MLQADEGRKLVCDRVSDECLLPGHLSGHSKGSVDESQQGRCSWEEWQLQEEILPADGIVLLGAPCELRNRERLVC
jgi:hypothetical protein